MLLLDVAPRLPRLLSPSPAIVVAATPSGLQRIREPGVGFVVWEPGLPPGARAAAHATARLEPGEAEAVGAPDAVADALADALPGGRRLRAEIRPALARATAAFAETLGAEAIKGLIEIVAHDKCRHLHVDRIALRLVWSLAGPGTEHLAPEDADYGALGRGDNHAVCRGDLGAVRRTPPGAALLMKGAAWPEPGWRGAVHRSPPVAALGLRRLVLTLDPVLAGGPE